MSNEEIKNELIKLLKEKVPLSKSQIEQEKKLIKKGKI